MEQNQADQLRILIADDESTILAFYREVLSSKQIPPLTIGLADEFEDFVLSDSVPTISTPSFDLTLCTEAEEVLREIKLSIEEVRPFAMAFLDIRISSDLDGVGVAEQIRAIDPNIEIIMMTGYTDIDAREIARRVPPLHKLLYLEKPLYPQEIHQIALALGSKWQAECERQKVHDELERWLEERTTELMNANEQLAEEIEERKRIEEALRKSEERHRIVLESVPDPVVVYDMEGKVAYFNPAFSRVFGWSLSEGIGCAINFVPVEHLSEVRLIFEKIQRGEMVSGIETTRLTKDGTPVEVSISGAGFFDHSGTLQGSVLTIQDITARKKTEQEIRYIAYHDILTGLHNRKSFYMRLEDQLLQSQSSSGKRRGSHLKWAILFLDLDRFKYVNDTLGHDVGDELLKMVSKRLQAHLRKSDYLFRLGGDEFTILLNGVTNNTDVAKVAKKLREEIARPYLIHDHEIYISVSIGISIYPVDGENVERLVKNADMAMYAAKEERQGFRFFTEEMNKIALERMMLEGSLRNALRDNQFIIYYQPLVDKRERIIGSEALLRWHHPEIGLISPSKFIPLAEETGVIIQIGKWVLASACLQAKVWYDRGYTEFYVAVNLSTRQFREPDLVETIEQVLEDIGLPPHCLKLEVTESGIMENPEQAIEKMRQLRQIGIHFSIDDFGTGYSSLSYLKRFPIDTLKIDRSFVIDSTTNKDDQEIIKTIIAMARNLKLSTVAEGVETKEQQDFLVTQGCQMMQGYYFGEPMPAEAFEVILQARKF
ncbi:sensory box/GGDEF family protein [Candidatus Vecturithrix granuli]|uniref:Sensory box/GGDEF family protein n=1 Tax=Vecturithrix granuli TaxID=1499967 RepID=A0A081C1J6_VECG1|nr:sensory box/GGDEF family protein [Candidatus Vecturithrix granuli]